VLYCMYKLNIRANDMKLTKKNALAIFKEELVLGAYADIRSDKIAMRESWSNFTDSLCKDNMITMSQYERWSNPY
jgi:hypothetical protein